MDFHGEEWTRTVLAIPRPFPIHKVGASQLVFLLDSERGGVLSYNFRQGAALGVSHSDGLLFSL